MVDSSLWADGVLVPSLGFDEVALAAVGRQPDPPKGEIAKSRRDPEGTREGEYEGAGAPPCELAQKCPRRVQFLTDVPRRLGKMAGEGSARDQDWLVLGVFHELSEAAQLWEARAVSKNIETVKELYVHFGQGDIPGILKHLDPEVEWEHDWGGEPLPLYAPRRGREAVDWFFEALAAFEFLGSTPSPFSRAATWWRYRSTARCATRPAAGNSAISRCTLDLRNQRPCPSVPPRRRHSPVRENGGSRIAPRSAHGERSGGTHANTARPLFPKRRTRRVGGIAHIAGTPATDLPGRDRVSDVTSLDAAALSVALEVGEVGASEVMAATLDRIERLNPKVNAIVSMRPREVLMAEARAAERTPRRGWLHGVPFAVKDLVETAGIRTTRGSPLLADHVPDADDILAARLRGAGRS